MQAQNINAGETTTRLDGRAGSGSPVGLLLLLSAVAGSTDAIGFLGLNGLFTAHITGNIVILASHITSSGSVGTAQMLSVPVFMAAVGLARLLGLALEQGGERTALLALLILQSMLLLAFFLLCLSLCRPFDPAGLWAVLAGMCGVSAMAVQNVLVQTSIPGAPSTAVLTSNVTRFAITAVDTVAGPAAKRKGAYDRATLTFVPIAGFVAGCALGGYFEWLVGLPALLLPVLLSLAAIVCNARGTA